MSYKEFDMSAIEEEKAKYAYEVKANWGNADAYAQSKERTEKYSKENWARTMNKSDTIMKNFAKLVNESSDSAAVQN